MPALDPILQITGGNEHRFSTLLRKYGYSGLLEFAPEEALFARHDGVFYDHLGSYLRLLRSEAPRMGYYYFDRLSPQITDAVHDKKIKLLLDQSAETIPLARKDESFKMDLASIYSELDTAGIDPARIMILNANLKAQSTHDRVCDELSLPNRMKFLSYDYFLFYSYLCFEKNMPTEEALKAKVSTASSCGVVAGPGSPKNKCVLLFTRRLESLYSVDSATIVRISWSSRQRSCPEKS